MSQLISVILNLTIPEEQRQVDRQLRKAGRDIERERRELEREEKKLVRPSFLYFPNQTTLGFAGVRY